MRRLVATAIVVGLCATAVAEPPQVELPLGPYVREGRPVVVRAPGADSVTVVGQPAVFPSGARGDEFVLWRPEAPGGVLSLTFTPPTRESFARLRVTVLPADGEVIGRFGDAAPGAIALPADGLPTSREAWLWLDRVEGEPPGAEKAVLDGLAAWRAGPRPGTGRGAFEPLAHAPSEDAFLGSAAAGRSAPGLPAGIVRLLLVLAVTEAVLALLAVRRPSGRGIGWSGLPSLLVGTWLLGWGGLPQGLRATAVVLDGPEDRLVVVRFEAQRVSGSWIELPAAATWPVFLRFSPDDESAATADVGRSFDLTLGAGESRLLAYRLPPVEKDGGEVRPAVDGALGRWIDGLGLEVTGAGGRIGPEHLPAASRVTVVPALSLRVAPGK